MSSGRREDAEADQVSEPIIDLQQLRERYYADPHGVLRELRESKSVHRVRTPDGRLAWLVVEEGAIREALTDPGLSSDFGRWTGRPEDERQGRSILGMLTSDDPRHRELRGVVSGAFTAREVEGWRPRVAEIAEGLLDEMSDRTEVDLVSDFAVPLTVSVISEILGVSSLDRAAFRAWTNQIVPDDGDGNALQIARAHLREVIRDKESRSGSDVLTALLRAKNDHNSVLDSEEVVSMVYLLLIAGHESTTNLILNTIVLLLGHPGVRNRLACGDVTIGEVIEESLRYEPPLMLSNVRFTSQSVTIGGTCIEKVGEMVLLAYAAAERDTLKFADAEAFCPGRKIRQSLAFGGGQHYCLGSSLARMESSVGLTALLARFPDMQMVEPPLRWRSTVTRGVSKLRVRLR